MTKKTQNKVIKSEKVFVISFDKYFIEVCTTILMIILCMAGLAIVVSTIYSIGHYNGYDEGYKNGHDIGVNETIKYGIDNFESPYISSLVFTYNGKTATWYKDYNCPHDSAKLLIKTNITYWDNYWTIPYGGVKR